jgi:CRISPR/Cas system CSM-associated protein Csm2 small subunit
MSHYSSKKLICACLVVLSCASVSFSQTRVRQRNEVIEAYRVCNRFQTIMAENIDFNRAFEATFVKNTARQREIAITEGEFDSDKVANVDTPTLVDAFKSRMQLLFLMMPLFSPNTPEEEATFFPPNFKTTLNRQPPEAPNEFAKYAVQLRRDVEDFGAHLNKLAQRYPNVAARIREFKRDVAKKVELPAHRVKPLTAYSRGRVLGLKEEYYQIGNFAVIREGREMRIIGIRFFTRLF